MPVGAAELGMMLADIKNAGKGRKHMSGSAVQKPAHGSERKWIASFEQKTTEESFVCKRQGSEANGRWKMEV